LLALEPSGAMELRAATGRPLQNRAGKASPYIGFASASGPLHEGQGVRNTNADYITATNTHQGSILTQARGQNLHLDMYWLLLFLLAMVLLVVVCIVVLSRARSGGGDFLASGFLVKKYYPEPLTARLATYKN